MEESEEAVLSTILFKCAIMCIWYITPPRACESGCNDNTTVLCASVLICSLSLNCSHRVAGQIKRQHKSFSVADDAEVEVGCEKDADRAMGDINMVSE